MAQGGGVFLNCAADSEWALARESPSGTTLVFESEPSGWAYRGLDRSAAPGYRLPAATYNQLHSALTDTSIISNASGPDVSGVFATLTAYFTGIDTHQYARAYAELGSAEQRLFSEGSFATNDSTTYVDDVELTALTPKGSGEAEADVSFTSQQASAKGPNGDTCDQWTLAYTMQSRSSGWVIAKTAGQDGSTHMTC